VYSSSITKTVEDEEGAEAEQEVHFLKQHTVFNAEQVEGRIWLAPQITISVVPAPVAE
jgi:antirestriction protein ArdC